MTTGQIIDNILSTYSKGVPSDDARLSPRHIFTRMVGIRSRLLVEKINKKQRLSQWVYQTLSCIEMEKAQPYDCPCIPPVGCGIFRTKEPLPQTLSGMNGHLIQSVTSLDGTTRYSETTWEEKRYKAGAKYTSKVPDFYIRDNHLFITADILHGKTITLTGLFNDPTDVWGFKGFCDNVENQCLGYMDREFPLDNDNVDTMIRLLKEEIIPIFSQMREDRTNNAADSADQESK